MKKIDWTLTISILFMIILGLLALFCHWIAPYEPTLVHWTQEPYSPSLEFLFGTDALGRDIFSRTIFGLRLSFGIAFIVALSAVLIGSVIGILAGYFTGKVDLTLIWLIDCFLAFPSLLLTIAISATLGPGLDTVFISLVVSSWASVARIIRSHVKQLKTKDFILSAKSLGGGGFHVITRHIIPHTLPIISVLFILALGSALLAETSLSFLGFGLAPPHPSLGRLIYDGASYLRTAPWWALFPGMMIAWSILSINMFGDRLRKILKLEFTL